MRRLLATGFVALLVAFGAACGDNGDDGDNAGQDPQAQEQPEGNTAEVCAGAETVQAEQMQQLNEEVVALEEQGLPEEELEEATLERAKEAIVGWSDGLHEQAALAEDPELSEALSGLADGLAEIAPDLTVEAMESGELPGMADLDQFGETLTSICYPGQEETTG